MRWPVDPPRYRGVDSWGSGQFLAPRRAHLHRGVDLAVEPGSTVVSPIMGVVDRIGWPYSDDDTYRIVDIVSIAGLRVRLFYVDPWVEEGTLVSEGQSIGAAQDIRKRYDSRMTPHIHMEAILPPASVLVGKEVTSEKAYANPALFLDVPR